MHRSIVIDHSEGLFEEVAVEDLLDVDPGVSGLEGCHLVTAAQMMEFGVAQQSAVRVLKRVRIYDVFEVNIRNLRLSGLTWVFRELLVDRIPRTIERNVKLS